MEFDKSIGCWDEIFATELDDIAYSLYIESIDKDSDEIEELMVQGFFVRWKELEYISKYYESAQLILRNEKLNKIKNRNK